MKKIKWLNKGPKGASTRRRRTTARVLSLSTTRRMLRVSLPALDRLVNLPLGERAKNEEREGRERIISTTIDFFLSRFLNDPDPRVRTTLNWTLKGCRKPSRLSFLQLSLSLSLWVLFLLLATSSCPNLLPFISSVPRACRVPFLVHILPGADGFWGGGGEGEKDLLRSTSRWSKVRWSATEREKES